ncbi:MAG: SLC13 family permease [Gammaproteobacteria bacterium]|nr:SLC13 family permease [Gammaproteobacteria bacterium]
MPPLPEPHAIAVILLTGVTLFLFARERIPLETTSFLVLVTLVLGFYLFKYPGIEPQKFFLSFGNEALVTICALLIVGKGVETTGALQPLAYLLASVWQSRPQLAMLTTLVVGAVSSAFLNNTPIVVMLLPILVAVCIRSGISSSGVLIPMGLSTLIGGMATTIGTSTNLLVVGIAAEQNMPKLNMFDFTLPVAMAAIPGILFLWLVAPKLLPERTPPMADTAPRVFKAMLFVNEDSFANGKTLTEVRAKTENRMRLERLQRGDNLSVTRLPSVVLQAGDRLYVSDTADRLKEYEQLLGATLYNETDVEHPVTEEQPLAQTEGQQLAEVVITRGSPMHNRTLNVSQFSQRYGLVPLAIHRARPTSDVAGELESTRLRAGDVILMQGSAEAIAELRGSGTMLVLDGTTDLPHTDRANTALAIMLLVVGAAAFQLLPISVSSLVGVVAMLLTGCLRWRDVGDSLNIPVIMIIVASLSLGTAMEQTGGAEYIAQLFVAATSDLPTAMTLSGMMLLMIFLTNVVSNNAAAVIGTPIAISVAFQLGVSPEPFVLAVIFGANMSFATPIGYQTNLLIMSAGGYRFSDFLRVGLPLTAIMWLTFSFVLPMLYDI